MEKRKARFSVTSVLRLLHSKTDETDLPKLIYVSMLLVLGFISFLSATISWIQLPSSFSRIVVLYAFGGFCILLLYLSQKKRIYPVLGFNLVTIGLLAYLYYPSGGSLGVTPLFILANTLFSWILLFGGSSKKIVASMLLHESLFIINPLIDILNPGLVAHRYPDSISHISSFMLWGSVSILFIVSMMWMWSKLFQSKLNTLMGKIEIDDLTGAYRKSFMLELIENIRTTSAIFHRRHSLAFVDLDNFKQINDSHGHLVGDEVLNELVQYSRKALRKSDYICRFGGDEFLLFFPDTNAKEALFIMDRFRQDVANNKWSSESIHITISVGIGELIMNKNTNFTLGLIDQKMYESKKSGKNKVTAL